jgi:cysteine desulfurase
VTARGLSEWRDAIERRILELSPKSRIFGREAGRLPNTICVTMPDVPAETQVMALDLAGVAVSSGSACSSGKVQPSHVLRAMGASREEAASAIRVSLGWSSRAEDVEAFLDAWAALYHRRAGGTPGAPQKTSSVA